MCRPEPAARRAGAHDDAEQLPKYEASPPGYETLYKDGYPPVVRESEMATLGESSAAGERGSGEVVINMEPAAPAPAPRTGAPPPPPVVVELVRAPGPPRGSGQ